MSGPQRKMANLQVDLELTSNFLHDFFHGQIAMRRYTRANLSGSSRIRNRRVFSCRREFHLPVDSAGAPVDESLNLVSSGRIEQLTGSLDVDFPIDAPGQVDVPECRRCVPRFLQKAA